MALWAIRTKTTRFGHHWSIAGYLSCTVDLRWNCWGCFYLQGLRWEEEWMMSDVDVYRVSNKDIIWRTGCVEHLKECWSHYDEEEDAEQPRTYLRSLLLFLYKMACTPVLALRSMLAYWYFWLLSFISWSFGIANLIFIMRTCKFDHIT